jgi:hypothetical protein
MPSDPLYKADCSFAAVLVGLKNREPKMVLFLFVPEFPHLVDQRWYRSDLSADRIHLGRGVILTVLKCPYLGDELAQQTVGGATVFVAHVSVGHTPSLPDVVDAC